MGQQILVFLFCLTIVCSGCAMESGTNTISTPAAVESASELPRMYGPLERQHRAMRPAEEVFARIESMRKLTRLTVGELKSVRNAGLSGVLISQCDLEVLKGLIASDLAPVVIVRSPVGPKHVRVVAGYDDGRGQIILVDPINFTTKTRLAYSKFSQQWDDPQKTCLLIFRRGSVDTIKGDLRKYLPEEKIDSLVIRK